MKTIEEEILATWNPVEYKEKPLDDRVVNSDSIF